MKLKIITLAIMIALCANAVAQRSFQIVSLKDTSDVRGIVLKHTSASTTIKTENGDIISIDGNRIQSVETFKKPRYTEPISRESRWSWDFMLEFSRFKRDFRAVGFSGTVYCSLNRNINIGAGACARLCHFDAEYENRIIRDFRTEPHQTYSKEVLVKDKASELSSPFYGAIKYDILAEHKYSPYIALKMGADFNNTSFYSDYEAGIRYRYKAGRSLMFSAGLSKFDLWFGNEFWDDYRIQKKLFTLKFGIAL